MGGMDDFLGIGGFGAVPKKLLRGERKLKAPVEKKEYVRVTAVPDGRLIPI